VPVIPATAASTNTQPIVTNNSQTQKNSNIKKKQVPVDETKK
jgi:hypothetical protein